MAQEHNHEHTVPCGLDIYSKNLYEQNPDEYIAAEAHSREQIQQWIAENKGNEKKADIITIPVVFHVVWSSNRPESNVSDEQIYSQIDALNRDFRAENDLSVVRNIFQDRIADMEIKFKLAEFDPEGNLTTGITRTETDVEEWSIKNSSDMKYEEDGGKDPWPSRQYLNIWIISRLVDGNGNGGIAGYAQPGSNFPSNSRIDGVVILHNYLGQIGTADPSNFGRTGTHEVGHWLSLHHLWGASNSGEENQNYSCFEEDDEITDTPFTMDANFGCNQNRNQCTNENPDFPDMIENYMDYASSSCQGLFTHGQKDRVHAILNTTRSQITTSAGIRERGANDVMLTAVLSPNNGDQSCVTLEPIIEVVNFGTDDLFYFEVEYSIGGESHDYQWIGQEGGLAPWGVMKSDVQTKLTITLPEIELNSTETSHTLEVTVRRPNGSLTEFNESDNTISVNFNTVNSGAFPYFNENFQFVVFPPIGWSVFNNDNDIKGRFKSAQGVGFGDEKAAIMENFGYDAPGEVDELILPILDFTGDLGDISLKFNYAYAYVDENSVPDVLSIMVSEDCGNSFVTAGQLVGEDLVTAAPTTDAFVPTEGDWKDMKVNLADFINTTNHIIVKFSQIRGSGNNLYIDEVDLLSETTDIDSVINTASELKLYPNPTTNSFQLEFEATDAANLQLSILDKAGRQISNQNIAVQSGLNQHKVALENLPSGVYFVRIQDGGQVTTKKLIVF